MKVAFHKGFTTTYIAPDDHGNIYVDAVEKEIRPDTGLISIMCLNNELGTRNPISDIGRICRKRRILFHTDCVQAYCTTPIDVEEDKVDLLSASGHKIYGPKGIGFLYARHKGILSPRICGSASQEYGLRGGTENVPAIVGFGVAAEAANIDDREHFYTLRRTLINTILSSLDGCNVGVHMNGVPCYGSKIVNLRFDGIDGETLTLLLNSKGVIVSAGSACSAHEAVPSHVLKAIGLTDEQARSSIRVSFSTEMLTKDAVKAAEIIAEAVKQLK